MKDPPRNLEDLKDLMPTSWYLGEQDTFRGPVESMRDRSKLFWWRKGNLHNIRQVVLMLWLIDVQSFKKIKYIGVMLHFWIY